MIMATEGLWGMICAVIRVSPRDEWDAVEDPVADEGAQIRPQEVAVNKVPHLCWRVGEQSLVFADPGCASAGEWSMLLGWRTRKDANKKKKKRKMIIR